jgi:hypothetical protein
MQRRSFGAVLGVLILATAIPAAAKTGTGKVPPFFGGTASSRSTPAASCAVAKAPQNPQTQPELRKAWWPELCGACSVAQQCVGLLVLDPRPCVTEDGGRGTCQNTGNYCAEDSNPDDNRDEVSCYCDYW